MARGTDSATSDASRYRDSVRLGAKVRGLLRLKLPAYRHAPHYGKLTHASPSQRANRRSRGKSGYPFMAGAQCGRLCGARRPEPSAGEAEDQGERALGSRPEFSDERLSARTDETAQDKGDDDRVIELPCHRDEIRDKVERQREVADQRRQKKLPSPRHARVTGKPADPGQHSQGSTSRRRAAPLPRVSSDCLPRASTG